VVGDPPSKKGREDLVVQGVISSTRLFFKCQGECREKNMYMESLFCQLTSDMGQKERKDLGRGKIYYHWYGKLLI